MREPSHGSSVQAVLSGRDAAILHGVLEAYFASGSPVGSRTLAEALAESPSSATIRHVLAGLEQAGFLHQPHTSAGRVPTAQAIRWWLRQLEAPSALSGRAPELERLLLDASDETTLWSRASEFLAEATQQMGVIAVQPWLDSGLRRLRFFRLTEHRVLAILVTADGQVRERVGLVPETYTQLELDTAANYFNHNFAGSTLNQIRRELQRRLEEDRAAYDDLLKRVLVLSHSGVLQMEDSGTVYVHGAGHLSEMLDSQKFTELLLSLNEKERWLRLLAEVGAAEQDLFWDAARCRVRVRVGLEGEQLPEFALITADCRGGALAILGSPRMHYASALATVALVGELVRRVLGDPSA